ncbi:structural protein MipA [Aurantiacibacter luteus]|uniref:Structural protein MipA n=1 Tax=Aurantiacibacter luteus TaxID=1581420 RepID=A0A0G9N059_9SPHN|nr:structural protein MipA [Aurantiacibacter luteus]
MAQDQVADVPIDPSETVFSGDYLSLGVGAAYSPSYTGSDDYVIDVLPIVQGSLGGIKISPRAGGITLDFIQDRPGGPGIDLGVAARIRGNRASQIKDEVVEHYGELDTAYEVGPSAGISFPAVLNPYDNLSLKTDVLFDVSGAHDGMTVSPSVTYFTPLSRAMAASLSIGTEWADEDFQDYYFRVDNSLYTGPAGQQLPGYEPDGGGFTSVGANLLLAYDLDGDLANGGLGLVFIGGYSRVLGDAADTPFTSIRGSEDQFLAAVGIGYTF